MDGEVEEWRPVVGHEQLYEVSDRGRVRSVGRKGVRSGHVLSRQWMKGRPGRPGGFLGVVICRDGRLHRTTLRVAREVLRAHKPVREMDRRVPVFINEDHRDCRLANLVWSAPRSRRPDLLLDVGRDRAGLDLGMRECSRCGADFRHYGCSFEMCARCRDREQIERLRLEHYDPEALSAQRRRRGNATNRREVALPDPEWASP